MSKKQDSVTTQIEVPTTESPELNVAPNRGFQPSSFTLGMSARSATLLIAPLLTSGLALAASKVTGLEFLGKNTPNELVIRGDSELKVTQQLNEADKQIILEIADSQLAQPGLAQKIDTSSFDGPVSLITPYEVKEQGVVRVALKLRESTGVELKPEGNSVRVVMGKASDESSASTDTPEIIETADVPEVPVIEDTPGDLPEAEAQAPVMAAKKDAEKSTEKTPALADGTQEIDDFLSNSEKRSFIGKPITLQVRNADVVDIFHLISEASGFNIVLSPGVGGKLTLSLVDVPWDLALDTVFQSLKLGGRRNGNVLRVAPLAQLIAEEQEMADAKAAASLNAPRITKIFAISYANAAELVEMIRNFGSASSQTGSARLSSQVQKTFVQVDNRTNSIVVQDTADRIEKIQKLVELLDTQTPQVLIEAKVVEVRESFSKDLKGSLGLSNNVAGSSQYFASFAGVNPVSGLVSTAGSLNSGSSGVAFDRGAGIFGLSPKVGFLPGLNRLNALLMLGESEEQAKIVASPRTVVMNKQKANITQGVPVPVSQISTVAATGGAITNTNIQQANLSLDVTPIVTNDGSVSMQLSVTRDTPSGQGIANRKLETNVLVESGKTLVIGGIYTVDTEKNEAGFPFLRKLPLIGTLFGSESSATRRTELLIFVTPRILNQKESGFTG